MDAQTFETEEIIRVPAFDSSSSSSSRPPTARPRSDSPPPARPASLSTIERIPSTSSPLPMPRRMMHFSGVLQDTFRIPSVGRRNRPHSSAGEEDSDGLVVIPPLGDRELDDNVRRLLESNNSATLRIRGLPSDADRDGDRDDLREDEMDVDELEADCLSSYNPSRAGSPAPGAQSSSAPSGSALARYDPVRRANLLERRESSSPYISRRGSSQGLRRHQRRTAGDGASDTEVDQDLAGTCFDPSGEYVYVAASAGIAEWNVRGAEQRWWSEPTFA